MTSFGKGNEKAPEMLGGKKLACFNFPVLECVPSCGV